jgi:allantoicase
LAAQAVVALVEIDTSGYIGNSPGMAEVRGSLSAGRAMGASAGGTPQADVAAATGPTMESIAWDEPSLWQTLLERTPLLPDTPHRFRVAPAAPCDLVRLDVFPDGGVARLRLYGSLTSDGLAQVRRRWAQTAL